MKTSDLLTVENRGRKNRQPLLDKMDAIASGVHARFEESTGFSRKVTDATISVARTLGVPDIEIKKWAASRSTQIIQESERIKDIKTLLEKYYGSSLGIIAPDSPSTRQ